MDRRTFHRSAAYTLGHQRASKGWLPEEAERLWGHDKNFAVALNAILALGETDARHHYELGLRDGGLPEHSG